MLRSDSIGKVASALAKARSDFGLVRKDSVNPHFKSRYADLATVLEAVSFALTQQHLTITQPTRIEDGKLIAETYVIHGESGEYIGAEYPVLPIKNDPQAYGSALTYARRYLLCSLLGVAADDDDDGNQASHSPPRQQQPAASPAPAKPPVTFNEWAKKAAAKLGMLEATFRDHLFGVCVERQLTTAELPVEQRAEVLETAWQNAGHKEAFREAARALDSQRAAA